MGKQPYIPFYVGDYLKDTRMLPLSVRGFWVDMILFMWNNPIRGELIGTLDEVARMASCSTDEAKFALNLLMQKKTAEIVLLPTGEFHIISRRMKRDNEISEKRSIAGKNGVKQKFANTFAQAKQQAKSKQNTDIDIDIEYDNENKNNTKESEKDFTKPDIDGDTIVFPIPGPAMIELWAEWKKHRWRNHEVIYKMQGEQAALNQLAGMKWPQIKDTLNKAISGNWKNLYPENNGNRTNNQGTARRADAVIETPTDYGKF